MILFFPIVLLENNDLKKLIKIGGKNYAHWSNKKAAIKLHLPPNLAFITSQYINKDFYLLEEDK